MSPTPTPSGTLLPHSVHPLLSRAQLVGRHDPSAALPVTLMLRAGTSDSDRQNVESYMQSQGFQLESRFVKNLGLRFKGTAVQSEQLFRLHVNDYQLSGRIFYANDAPLTLPAQLARSVVAVLGLNNATRLQPRAQPKGTLAGAIRPSAAVLQAAARARRTQPASRSATPASLRHGNRGTRLQPKMVIGPSGGGTPPYLPSQVKHLYNVDALNAAGFKGAGQTIGIITFAQLNGSNDLSDVRGFEAGLNLPQSFITVAPPLGTPDTDVVGEQETTLDVSWASAMAPGASIAVVESTNDVAGYVNALNALIVNYSPTVISISWGTCDAQVPATEQDALDSLLQTVNVPVFVASGDAGSRDCLLPGGSPDSTTVSASWPATDPYVTAVGGTTIGPDVFGNPSPPETAWNSSGGGFSTHFAQPSYQTGSAVSLARGVPDIAALGDPATGVAIYDAGQWLATGGTSAAAPIAAGIMATVNQARGSNLGFPNSALYAEAAALNDINPSSPVSNGDYTTGPGWDAVTGLGSIDARRLLNALGGPLLPLPAAPAFPAAGTYDDSDFSAVTYTPLQDWSACTPFWNCLFPFSSSESVASTAGDSAIFQFNGSTVTIVFSGNSDGGIAAVDVDGTAQAPLDQFVDTTASFGLPLDNLYVTYGPFPSGNHTLTLTVSGTANPSSIGTSLYVDAFVVDVATISGHVLDAGIAAPGVSLDATCLTPDANTCGWWFGWWAPVLPSGVSSDANGAYGFIGTPGNYEIYAPLVAGGTVNSLSTTVVSAGPASSPTNKDVLVGDVAGTVTGLVTGAGGAGVASPVELDLPSQLLTGLTFPVTSGSTDGTQPFSLTAASGSYSLTASPVGLPKTSVGVTVPTGGGTVTRNVSVVPYPVTVQGVVKDSGGNPVGGVTLSADFSPLNTACQPVTACIAAFDGPSDPTTGAYTMHVAAVKYDVYADSGLGNPANSIQQPTLVDATTGQTLITGKDVVVGAIGGTLSGVITGAAGEGPIAGASVQLGLPSDIFPGQLVFVASATTDASGFYRLQAAPGTYTLQVDAHGYFSSVLPNTVVGAGSATRNLTLSSFPVTISGRVLNGTAPVPGVFPVVTCTGPDGVSCSFAASDHGATDADGNYEIFGQHGIYELRVVTATAFGATVNSTSLLTVDASSGSIFTGQDLEVAPASVQLSGTVTSSANGAPLPGASVEIGFPSAAGGLDLVTNVLTDASGQYSTYVAPGTYSVTAAANGVVLPFASLQVSGSSMTKDFSISPWPVSISGRVLLNGNTPVAGVRMSLKLVTGSDFCNLTGQQAEFGFDTSTDSGGNYTLHGPAGKYDVYVSADTGNNVLSLAPLFVDASGGGNFGQQNVTVVNASASLTGTLTDASNGSFVSGANVFLEIPSQASPGNFDVVASATSDPAGHYALPAAAGPFTVLISASGFPDTPASVSISGSAVSQNFSLTPNGPVSFGTAVTITGRVLQHAQPVSGITVSVNFLSAAGTFLVNAAPSDSGGVYTFHGPAGLYDLFATAGTAGNTVNSGEATFVDASSGSTFIGKDVLVDAASGSVSGTITKSGPATPVSGALVDVAIPSHVFPGSFYVVASGVTDQAGHYSVPVAPGTYTMEAAASGFDLSLPQTLIASGTGETQDFGLSLAPPPPNPTPPAPPASVCTVTVQGPASGPVSASASSAPPPPPAQTSAATELAPGAFLLPAGQLTVSQLVGVAPVSASAAVQAGTGGDIIAGNVGISIPAGALAGIQGAVTVAVTAQPQNVVPPGGPVQFSPNGTVLDVSVKDSGGNPVTTFPAPITLTMKYNAADIGQSGGHAELLTAAYVIDENSPDIENPLHFPVGTFVLFPPSNTVNDTTAGTVTVSTQSLGSVLSVVTNPVGYVQTVTPDTPELSSFDTSNAITFGTKPQFSYLQVVEPQIGTRLLVLDPDTGNYAYVNATDVGPSGAPSGGTATAVVRGLLAGDGP